ncbi:MAG: ATP synthase F0 subunit B [Verrucomicrobia bacterium]|nr:ATP synthase F0 subunit B [Verrucomicrobiota bacterium]
MDIITKVLSTFGVEWPMFIAQVIIFMIVYAVLQKFVFPQVTSMLEERRRRIEEGEANLAKIKSDLESAERKASEIIGDANKQAERMIREATDSAMFAGEKKKQEAVAEAGQIISKAKEASQLEHEKLMAELKRDFGRLLVDTTTKVTGRVLTQEDQDRINKDAVSQVAL